MTPHGPWLIRSSREIYRDPWVHLRQDQVTRPDGQPGTYCVVGILPGVTVVALDDDDHVHLVREFRYAIGEETLEGVSGAIEADETPEQAAQRELREELGLEAAEWIDLGRVHPYTSIVQGAARLFLARQLRSVPHAPEGTERIQRVILPLADAITAIIEHRIIHAPTCTALFMADHWLRSCADRADSL